MGWLGVRGVRVGGDRPFGFLFRSELLCCILVSASEGRHNHAVSNLQEQQQHRPSSNNISEGHGVSMQFLS